MGEQALSRFNYPAAADYFSQALEAFPEEDAGNRYRAVLGHTRAHEILGNRDTQRADVTALQTLAARLGDTHRRAEAILVQARFLWQTGDYAQAEATASRGLPLAEHAPAEMHAALLEILGQTARAQGHYAQARTWFEQALASLEAALTLNREIGRRRGEGYVLYTRGITLMELGQMSEAQASLEASLVIRHELGERDNLTDTYCTVTRFHLTQGRVEMAEQAFASAQQFHHPEQDSTENRRNFHYTAYLLEHARGNPGPAQDHLLRAEAAMQEMAHARRAEVRLLRVDAPRGRKRMGDDYRSVTWTLAHPGDDRITPASARRQHLRRRLLARGRAHGRRSGPGVGGEPKDNPSRHGGVASGRV